MRKHQINQWRTDEKRNRWVAAFNKGVMLVAVGVALGAAAAKCSAQQVDCPSLPDAMERCAFWYDPPICYATDCRKVPGLLERNLQFFNGPLQVPTLRTWGLILLTPTIMMGWALRRRLK